MKKSSNNHNLLAVKNLGVKFPIGHRSKIHAVSGVSFQIDSGETLGLVGESGCGKSTLARTITQLQKPSSGEILFDGKDLIRCDAKKLRRIRPRLQMIFQDAVASLNPGRRIGATIAEPLRVMRGTDRQECLQKARHLMREVGLDPDLLFDRRPFELSGGQCQRVSIARALMTQPKLLICDEPVSSLDVSIQAQILNLLRGLKSRFDLTLLFISHDLAVVKNVCDRVAVMYLGKFCETAPTEALFRMPVHPYTAALIGAIPSPGVNFPVGKVRPTSSEIPSPINPPSGCRFHTRCPSAQPLCSESEPILLETGQGRQVACHFPLQGPLAKIRSDENWMTKPSAIDKY